MASSHERRIAALERIAALGSRPAESRPVVGRVVIYDLVTGPPHDLTADGPLFFIPQNGRDSMGPGAAARGG